MFFSLHPSMASAMVKCLPARIFPENRGSFTMTRDSPLHDAHWYPRACRLFRTSPSGSIGEPASPLSRICWSIPNAVSWVHVWEAARREAWRWASYISRRWRNGCKASQNSFRSWLEASAGTGYRSKALSYVSRSVRKRASSKSGLDDVRVFPVVETQVCDNPCFTAPATVVAARCSKPKRHRSARASR
jgi:hypothetical protein